MICHDAVRIITGAIPIDQMIEDIIRRRNDKKPEWIIEKVRNREERNFGSVKEDGMK